MYNVDALVKDILGKDITLCRDYPSIIKWSVEQIEKWTDSWTDYTITDPGILFINADAYLYDTINYILDETYLNDILRYTKSMPSLYSMSKFAGLTLPGYTCATAKVTIHSDFGEVGRYVTIPKGFGIYVKDSATNEVVYFYSLQDLRVRYKSNVSGMFIEGKRTEVDTTFGEFYDDANFEFTIPDPMVGLNSIFLYAEYEFEGGEYLPGDPTMRRMLQVDDALLNLASEPCFSAYYAYNKVVIQLCPGAADFLNRDSKIKIIYGNASGLNANVGKVQAKPIESLYDGNDLVSNDLTFTVLYASGATIPYELEDTRVFIGNNVWRPETLIINADFDNLMNNKFPDIARFSVVQEKGSEDMYVYYVPEEVDTNGQPITVQYIQELETEIYDYAKDLMFGGVKLILERSEEVVIDFVVEAYLNVNTSNTDDIHDAVVTVLKDFFDRDKQPRNFYFRRGYAITAIESGVDEIYSIDLIYPVIDMQAADNQIFVLGNVTTYFKQRNDFEEWD